MEASLVNNASITFKKDGGDQFSSLQNIRLSASMKVVNVTGSHTKQMMQNRLKSLLNVDSAILCSLNIGRDNGSTKDQLQIMWASKEFGSFFQTLSPKVKNSAGLQMKVEFGNNFRNVSQIYPLKNLVQQEGLTSLVMNFGKAPAELVNKWKPENGQIGSISGNFTLNLVLDEVEFLNNYFANRAESHCTKLLAKMLVNAENSGDLVITSAGGAKVKCDKAVLVASCPYFEAMFKSGMWASTNEPALENIGTAWVLLRAGMYYELDGLVSGMREILMVRENEKFSVELALEMLLFVREIAGYITGRDLNQGLNGIWNDLSLKSVHVLKWYSKERPMELMASEMYTKLYVETPQLAMELHAKFMQFVDTESIEKGMNNGTRNFMV